MNYSPFKSFAIALHRDLVDELFLICQNPGHVTIKKLEAAMEVCTLSILDLYALIPQNGFYNLEEEILFFKSIKPLFTAEREYHQRLYHAELFGEDSAVFWNQELTRMDKLLNRHMEFSSYYHNNSTHYDAAWFSQGQSPLPTPLCMLPLETNPKHNSARDGWVSGLIAVERYRNWLVAKYNEVDDKTYKVNK